MILRFKISYLFIFVIDCFNMTLFLWDLHGVLEKGTENAVLAVSNHVLERAGYVERFCYDDMRKLYGKKWWQYFEKLLPGMPEAVYRDLQAACFGLSDDQFGTIVAPFIGPNDNAYEVLSQIQCTHEQILISNSEDSSLRKFTRALGIDIYFPEGYAIATNSHTRPGRSKNDLLAEFLRGRNFDGIVIVGDSPDDMQLKSVAGGITYLYAHPGWPFRECEADHRINDLRNVLNEL